MALTPLNQPQFSAPPNPLGQLAQIIQIKELVTKSKQEQAGRSLLSSDLPDEELVKKLRGIDPDTYIKFQNYIRQADLADLQKSGEKMKLAQGHHKYVGELLQTLRDSPEDDQHKQLLLSHMTPAFEASATSAGLPVNEQTVPRTYDPAVVEANTNTAEHLKVLSSMADAKYKERDQAMKEADEARKKLAADQATTKFNQEQTGVTPADKEFTRMFASTEGIPDLNALDMQSQDKIRRSAAVFKAQLGKSPDDTERFVNLAVKVRQGTATPTEGMELDAMKQKIKLAGDAAYNRANPEASADRIKTLADVADSAGLDAATKLIVGNEEKRALGEELGRRGGNVFKTLSDIQKVTGQQATFSNIHNNINNIRTLLPIIKSNPTLVSMALATPDSEIGKQLQGKIINKQLTIPQLNLVQGIRTLREDLFGIRQFFGNSPVRSNSQVQIMLSQVPDEALLTTGDPEKIDVALKNLERSIAPVEEKFGKFTGGIGTGRTNDPAPAFIKPGGALEKLLNSTSTPASKGPGG